MEVAYKLNTRRWVSLPMRDLLGLNALDQLELCDARNAMSMLCELKKVLEMEGLMTPARHDVFVNMFLAVGMEMERILTIEVPEGFDSRRRIKQQMDWRPRCFEDFRRYELGRGEECFSSLFRFQSVDVGL